MGFAPDVSACTGDKDRPVEAGRRHVAILHRVANASNHKIRSRRTGSRAIRKYLLLSGTSGSERASECYGDWGRFPAGWWLR